VALALGTGRRWALAGLLLVLGTVAFILLGAMLASP